VWRTLIHLPPLPNDDCFQLAVANCQQTIRTFWK
jgi:hypothetical protein